MVHVTVVFPMGYEDGAFDVTVGVQAPVVVGVPKLTFVAVQDAMVAASVVVVTSACATMVGAAGKVSVIAALLLELV
jgi:hypothetical protein